MFGRCSCLEKINQSLWQERYSRQILFAPLGSQGQEKLLQSRVAVIGLGALGTVSANCLARAGVGYLRLVDRDYVEPSNLQRQILYTEEDAARIIPKAEAAREKLAAINSGITYDARVEDVNYTNVQELISDVDLIIDATDNFEIRFLLNEACVHLGKTWIHGACVASYGITFNIIPGETACFACFLGDMHEYGSFETCDTVGVLSPIVNVIASLQSMEAIKILSGNRTALHNGVKYIDLWRSSWTEFALSKNDQCTVCGQKSFSYLPGQMRQQATSLCGRETIQIMPPREMKLSLQQLAEKLAALGTITGNEHLLKFSIDQYEMVIFPDGRAMIKGTADAKIARSLYARYIGG